jgi:PKD repeat protein
LIQDVEVDEGLQADISWDGSASGCAPFQKTFEGLPSDAETFDWTFDGGQPASSTEASPTVTYADAGSYSVTLIVTMDGETDTLTLTDVVQVNDGPEADFDFSINDREVSFTNLSSNFDDVLWAFGDGSESSEENPIYTYSADGQYSVTLTAWNECDTITVEEEITVATLPTADFTIPGDSEGCIPLEVTFEDNSSENTIGLEWIFEGGNPSGSTDPNPTITYEEAGTYSVTLIVESLAGFDTMEIADAVVVNPDIDIDFDQDVDSLNVEFFNITEHATSYMWSFGDGNTSTEENPVHNYEEAGLYTVSLTAMNECDTVSLEREIGVGGVPTANFEVAGSATGCAPFEVEFQNTSNGVTESIEWVFDGGTPATSTEENPVVTYTEPGMYDVTLIVGNAAGTNQYTRQQFVRVNVLPDAEISSEELDEFTYGFNSEIGDALSVDFRWEFGDGNESTEPNAEHTYAEAGMYEVLFIWSNDCGVDTLSLDVDIISSSLTDIQMSSISLFPNPTSGQVTLAGVPIGAQVAIYDMNGRLMHSIDHMESARKRLRLTDFASGVYVVRIAYNGVIERRKLVVK